VSLRLVHNRDDAGDVITTPDTHTHTHTHNCSCLLGRGGSVVHVPVCVTLCVYQLSASMVCMTPELADSHGSKVTVEPVWAFLADPDACSANAHTNTRGRGRGGGWAAPPTRLISPLGLGSRQKHIDPNTHTHTHTHTPGVSDRP